MGHYGFVMQVREGYEEEYRIRHEAVYPELLSIFDRLGIHSYSIFMHERYLFAYMKVEGDFEQTMEILANEEVNKKWQEFMKPIMIPWEDGNLMKRIPEVFYHA